MGRLFVRGGRTKHVYARRAFKRGEQRRQRSPGPLGLGASTVLRSMGPDRLKPAVISSRSVQWPKFFFRFARKGSRLFVLHRASEVFRPCMYVAHIELEKLLSLWWRTIYGPAVKVAFLEK